MRITIETPLHATEDPERVLEAATVFFPDAELDSGPSKSGGAAATFGATARDVEALRQAIWQQRIIDTVRSRMLAGIDGPAMRLELSKQAAAQGKISFSPTPHPLGEVVVQLTVEETDPWPDAESLAWYLCPETRDGKIVE